MADSKEDKEQRAAAKAAADLPIEAGAQGDVAAVRAHTVTPGVAAEAQTIDQPMAIAVTGPRDALLQPRDGDIIPELETKGYHVGQVAQPAELVGVDGIAQGFRSDKPSRFPSLAETKARHNARESGQGKGFGRAASPDPTSGVSFVPGLGMVRISGADAGAATDPANGPAAKREPTSGTGS